VAFLYIRVAENALEKPFYSKYGANNAKYTKGAQDYPCHQVFPGIETFAASPKQGWLVPFRLISGVQEPDRRLPQHYG